MKAATASTKPIGRFAIDQQSAIAQEPRLGRTAKRIDQHGACSHLAARFSGGLKRAVHDREPVTDIEDRFSRPGETRYRHHLARKQGGQPVDTHCIRIPPVMPHLATTREFDRQRPGSVDPAVVGVDHVHISAPEEPADWYGRAKDVADHAQRGGRRSTGQIALRKRTSRRIDERHSSVSEIGSERPIHNVKRDDRRDKSRVETLNQLDCGDVATAEFVAEKGKKQPLGHYTQAIVPCSRRCILGQHSPMPAKQRASATHEPSSRGFQVRKIGTSNYWSMYDIILMGEFVVLTKSGEIQRTCSVGLDCQSRHVITSLGNHRE